MNRKAGLVASLTVLVYYGFSIALYNICYSIVGYQYWDSTVIHYPSVLPTFAFISLVPSTFAIYVLVRGIHVYYSVKPEFSWSKLNKIMNIWLLGRDPEFTNAGFIYLFRYYLLFFTVVSWLIFLVLQSTYAFIIVPVFEINFVDTSLWMLRFRIVSVQLMSLPLTLASVILMFFGFPYHSSSTDEFDPIYLLKIQKSVYRSSGVSEINNDTLAPLSSRIFYTAIWKEKYLQKFSTVSEIDDVALMELSISTYHPQQSENEPFLEVQRLLEEELTNSSL